MADLMRLTPPTEMGEGTYKGEDGGLYGGGRNQPPPEHKRAAAQQAAKIIPLDLLGSPAPEGKMCFLSIGMSNTRDEFSHFIKVAEADPEISPDAVFVNDGTHLTVSGREKVASLLLGFLKTNDSARDWFLKETGNADKRSESERRSP